MASFSHISIPCNFIKCAELTTGLAQVHHALTTRTLTLATQGMQDTVGVQQAQLMRSISQWRSPYREQVGCSCKLTGGGGLQCCMLSCILSGSFFLQSNRHVVLRQPRRIPLTGDLVP